jgi:flagellar biosynthesis protein FlhA
MYQLLGVDVLTIYIGENLIPIADIEIGGELIENIGNLRQYLTLTQGFILPTVRICDAKFLKPNEYQILVRGNVVASSLVHIDRYFILKRHWDKSFDTPLKDAIEGCEPNLKEAAYWIDKTEIDNLVKENKWTQPYETASEAITYHIAETASLYIDQLLTKVEVRKILDQVSQMDPGLVDGIVPTLLTVSEIRKILVNLLREKVSIRDIHFILEKLEDLALEIRTIDVLSERLRILLSRQICVQYADDKTIKAISLSSEIEKKMEDSIQVIDNEVLLGLEKEFAKKIVDKISALRNQIQNNSIVICPQVIRLPLARLLQAFDKRIVVMSPLEICPEFIVEIIGTIEIDS